jgi:hypothetical protein
VRNDWEQQGYFPLQLATRLCQQFAAHGLQFFKVNKTVTHVGVARPQFLDLETTPVSESIKSIIGFINTNPKCTRRNLIETLAPSPAVIEVKPAEQKSAEPTPEQNALIADLHWLIHQGHVLEFADGRMDTAKKPLPRPLKPEKKKAEEKPDLEGETAAATETAPQAEVVVESAAETAAETPGPVEATAPASEAPASGETISSAAGPAPVSETTPPPEEVASPS